MSNKLVKPFIVPRGSMKTKTGAYQQGQQIPKGEELVGLTDEEVHALARAGYLKTAKADKAGEKK